MVLAVLEARCGIKLGAHDVHLNVAGGFRISEPAADVAVAAALISSLSGAVLPPDSVYFGEVSLTGAVRAVPHAVARLKEAAKLGFTRAVAPAAKGSAANGRDAGETPLAVDAITSLGDIVATIAAKGSRRSSGKPQEG
jgi:DNA repair protein RadA/Sms